MNKNKLTILYFGPITPRGGKSSGGYAAANRKNIDKLRELGVEVIEFPKKTKLSLLFQPFYLFKYKISYSVIHIATPLGGALMLPVLLILLLAKILNIPSVLDIRAGFFIERYKKYAFFYKWITRLLLYSAKKITVESGQYVNQIKKLFKYKKDIHYFPNTVDCNNIQYFNRLDNVINLFYFGRITKSKGVDTMMQLISLLDKRFHFYLAGPIADDINIDYIQNEKTTYLGLLNNTQLNEYMCKMHFFIFPTRHKGEGQSNSLIEAMSYGIIPITSNQGFCSEVVADCGFILPVDATGKDYTRIIKKVVENNSITILSERCKQHIIKNHNLDTEIKKMIEQYNLLLCH